MAKKKIVKSGKKTVATKKTLSPTASRTKANSGRQDQSEPLLFGKQNYILLLAGGLLMAIGFLLMLGGGMSDPTVWDEDIIYGFRRIVLAPFMILAGLVTLVFAIFKKQTVVSVKTEAPNNIS